MKNYYKRAKCINFSCFSIFRLSFLIDGSIVMYKSKFKVKKLITTNPEIDYNQREDVDEYDVLVD